ncbi:MAG TPA: branched-chain amino acid ABC transporter permease [Acidimicrobiales bacterium]
MTTPTDSRAHTPGRINRRPPDWVRLPRQTLLRHLLLAAVVGVLVFWLSDNVGSFTDLQLSNIAAYTIALAGLCVLTGHNGQLSLGHGAFIAIGAYTTALILEHTSLPIIVVLFAAIGVSAVAGAILGVAAARLRGPYLAGATLALAVALPSVAIKWSSIFGGEQGITVNPLAPPPSLGLSFPPERWVAWLALLTALIVLVLLANLLRSRVGRSFRAVRDDEIAASLAGVHVARTQVLAFVVSAACAGLAGAFFAFNVQLVAPAGFPLSLSIALVTGIVVGGINSLVGAVWGGILLVYLNQEATDLAKHFHISAATGANWALLAYGVLLIAVMLVFPDGIQGGIRRLGRLVTRQ